MNKIIVSFLVAVAIVPVASATIVKESVRVGNEKSFLLLKFTDASKTTYRTLSRALVEAGLKDLVGGCRQEEIIVDRFGRTKKQEICRLSFQAPKEGIKNLELRQFIDLGMFINQEDQPELFDVLRKKIGKKNPTLLTAGSISTRGVRSCTVTNSNPSCGTRRVPAVVGLQGLEARPALSSKDKRFICTFNSSLNPSRSFEAETCFLNLSNEPGLSETDVIARYPKGSAVLLFGEVKCSEKKKRIIGGSRSVRLYPNRVQTFIANSGQYAFEFSFEREFKNVVFSSKVEDLGVFCSVASVMSLAKPSGYELAHYNSVIACDTARIEERQFVSRLATFDSRSSNFPMSQL
jgi:hypothetical protein